MTARWVPPTLRGYRASWLAADALAGLTLVAVALPGQMATAQLANLPAVAGLYAFVAGSLVYALLGTNPHLSVGADSTIAPLLATGVASVAAVGTSSYGAEALAVIAAAQKITHRLPGTLLALVLSIVAVDTLGLASHHGVAILGAAHGGLPRVRLPSLSWSQLRRMPGLSASARQSGWHRAFRVGGLTLEPWPTTSPRSGTSGSSWSTSSTFQACPSSGRTTTPTPQPSSG
jgi:sulfate permease, SulP family